MMGESREPETEKPVTRRNFIGAAAAALLWPGEDVTIVEFTNDGRAVRTVTVPKIEKSDEQWRRQLGAQSYSVTREGGTEPAFSGRYWELRDRGMYRCICCDNALFYSTTKFYPGTGWASFSRPIADRNVVIGAAARDGVSRVTCRRCDAHLGDRFSDRTTTSGLRYSVNSAALRFFRS